MGLQVKTISSAHEARQLAEAAHYGQWVGNTPFVGYLARVEEILEGYTELDSQTRITIWLHETLATPISRSTLDIRFGSQIGLDVQTLTLPEGGWEEAQLERCRLVSKQNERLASILLAARIAAAEMVTPGSMEHYRYRWTLADFKEALGFAEELSPLWEKLEMVLTT